MRAFQERRQVVGMEAHPVLLLQPRRDLPRGPSAIRAGQLLAESLEVGGGQ